MEDKPAALVIAIAIVLTFWITGFFSYRFGYREGQLDYARNHIRWTIMDGIITEFHGLDAKVETK